MSGCRSEGVDCSKCSYPQPRNSCCQVECLFSEQWGRWCERSEAGGIRCLWSAGSCIVLQHFELVTMNAWMNEKCCMTWMYSSRLEVPNRGAVLIWSMELRHPALPVPDHHSRHSAAAQCRLPSQVAPTSRRSAQPCVTATQLLYHQVWITRRPGRSTSKNGRRADLCPTRTTFFLTPKFWLIIQHRRCC